MRILGNRPFDEGWNDCSPLPGTAGAGLESSPQTVRFPDDAHTRSESRRCPRACSVSVEEYLSVLPHFAPLPHLPPAAPIPPSRFGPRPHTGT